MDNESIYTPRGSTLTEKGIVSPYHIKNLLHSRTPPVSKHNNYLEAGIPTGCTTVEEPSFKRPPEDADSTAFAFPLIEKSRKRGHN